MGEDHDSSDAALLTAAETEMNHDLTGIGDALERAVANDILAARNTATRRGHAPTEHVNVIEEDPMLATDQSPARSANDRPRRARRSRRIAVIGALAVLGIGGAAAAAVSMSSDDVSNGLPGGSMIFQGTNPSCTSGDGVVFDCTLASAPTQDVLNDYKGSAQLFVDQHLDIAGGCRGRSADGLQWTCYLGQRAVDEGILAADLLGQHSPAPSRG